MKQQQDKLSCPSDSPTTYPSKTEPLNLVPYFSIYATNKEIKTLKGKKNSLTRNARKLNRLVLTARVLVASLGVLIIAREAVNRLPGPLSATITITYIIICLTIITIAGIETAFKWEEKSAELKIQADEYRKKEKEVQSKQEKPIPTYEQDRKSSWDGYYPLNVSHLFNDNTKDSGICHKEN